MDTERISEAYERAAKTFTERHPKSKQLHEQACNSLPGGNVRTVLFYNPFPLSIARGSGSKLYDADGHEYVDLLGEYTAGLYGHSDPTILKAITDALQRGISYGGQHEDEHNLAMLIKQRFPSIELLRFTNSGTEANLMALAAAKVYTGKKKIVVFDGGYHGGVLSFKGGKGTSEASHRRRAAAVDTHCSSTIQAARSTFRTTFSSLDTTTPPQSMPCSTIPSTQKTWRPS